MQAVPDLFCKEKENADAENSQGHVSVVMLSEAMA